MNLMQPMKLMKPLACGVLVAALLAACAPTQEDPKPMPNGNVVTTTSEVKLVSMNVDYLHGDVPLEGYVSYRADVSTPKAAVMVVHNWIGISDVTRQTCDNLAKLGYVAFAADIYGKGIRPKNAQEASAQATIYRSDRALLRARANAGLQWMKKHSLVDPKRIAAIGYCFGGGTVLELARSGADFSAAVSFHGNLDTPNAEDAKNIKAKVLVLHGADDPFVPPPQVEAFMNEMKACACDWQLIHFSDAVHSFTDPTAGSDKSKGAAYNERAARRAWQSMQRLFAETIDRRN